MAAPGSDTPDSRPAQPAGDGRTLWEDDRPGDSVCWLRLVCAECGAMAEVEPPVDCPQCGARIEPGR
jgi:rubrerythrin